MTATSDPYRPRRQRVDLRVRRTIPAVACCSKRNSSCLRSSPTPGPPHRPIAVTSPRSSPRRACLRSECVPRWLRLVRLDQCGAQCPAETGVRVALLGCWMSPLGVVHRTGLPPDAVAAGGALGLGDGVDRGVGLFGRLAAGVDAAVGIAGRACLSPQPCDWWWAWWRGR